MKGKHFISDPAALVDGMCRAVASQSPGLRYDSLNKVVFRASDDSQQKVRLISGGGSGHEPAHAGYVGHGMLDAAVCGAIFASPNVGQILQGLQHIASPAGILVIVKNYTGDKLNFGLATEEFRAKTGIPIRSILVADDVAVSRSRGSKVGRRGLSGTIFVHKVAGAASQRGITLSEVADLAQHVSDNLATVGASLDRCSVPGQPDTSLKADELELGMGIHNEPGVETVSPQPDHVSLIDRMLSYILDNSDAERAFVDFGSDLSQAKIALLVNNLGGLSTLEIQAISHTVLERLRTQHRVRPIRVYVGTYLTSLDGPGFSITLLNLSARPQEILSLLDEETPVAAWQSSAQTGTYSLTEETEQVVSGTRELPSAPAVLIPGNMDAFAKVLQSIERCVVTEEPDITRFDTLMGDGDCGTTLVAGAKAAVSDFKASRPTDLSTACLSLAATVRDAMGGTSGAIYGLFLGAFASALQEQYVAKKVLDVSVFAGAITQALSTLKGFTAARKGSRTLMDALIPLGEAMQDVVSRGGNMREALAEATQAATAGLESTKEMVSAFGRSTYVAAGSGDSHRGNDPTRGIPDPGAYGVVAVWKGIVSALEAEKSMSRSNLQG